METLIIYDSTGYIISQMSGDVREPVGIPFMWAEIPEGKRVIAIDVTKNPHEPILEDYPKTDTEKLQENQISMANAIVMLSMQFM